MPRELPTIPELQYPFCCTIKLWHGNQAVFSDDLGVRVGHTSPEFAQIVIGYNQQNPVRLVADQSDMLFKPSEGIGMRNGKLRTNSNDAFYIGGKYKITLLPEEQGVRVKVESQVPVVAQLVGKKRQIATHLKIRQEAPITSAAS